MCLMEYISGKTETGTKCQGLSASFNESKMKVETVKDSNLEFYDWTFPYHSVFLVYQLV